MQMDSLCEWEPKVAYYLGFKLGSTAQMERKNVSQF